MPIPPAAERALLERIQGEIERQLEATRPLPFTRLPLYPKQQAIIDDPARFTITEATTKAGKTFSHIEWLLDEAIRTREGNWWWVATVGDIADIAFRRSEDRLLGFIDSGGVRKKIAEPIPFKINRTRSTIEVAGATVWYKSADQPDSLYGEDVRAAVGDEITRWKERAWVALYTTLTATKGRAKLIGNVNGRRNFAYHLARKAENREPGWSYHKLTAFDAIEGGVLDKEIIDQARRDLTENVFRELYMAEASDDGLNPFGLDAIRACIGILSTNRPVVFGGDLAKSVDWTWIIGLDAQGRAAISERWQTPWRETMQTVIRLVDNTPALLDSTGVGDPIVEEVQRSCSQVQGYHFHPASKQRLMEGLAAAIQKGEVVYPDGPLVQELEAFEYRYTRLGVQYEAAEGMHDDGVCALALAVLHGKHLGRFQFTTPPKKAGTIPDRYLPRGGDLSTGWMR